MFDITQEGIKLLIQIMGIAAFGTGMFLSIVIWDWIHGVFNSLKTFLQLFEVSRKQRRDLVRRLIHHERSKIIHKNQIK